MTWKEGTLCDRHEIAYCADCKPKTAWDWFLAQYAGSCAACGWGILVGDRVRWNPEGTAVQHERH